MSADPRYSTPAHVIRLRLGLDRRNALLSTDEGLEQLTGFGVDELRAQGLALRDLVHPDDRNRLHRIVRASIPDRSIYLALYRIRTKWGTTRWIEEQGRGIYATDGTPMAIDATLAALDPVVIERLSGNQYPLAAKNEHSSSGSMASLSAPFLETQL